MSARRSTSRSIPGLNRLGFEPHELVDAIEDYLHVSEIEIAGVFSHFRRRKNSTHPPRCINSNVRARVGRPEPLFERHRIVPLRHIAASAAAILWPQTRLDLSRFGIALYGLWPSKATREAAVPTASRSNPRSGTNPKSSSCGPFRPVRRSATARVFTRRATCASASCRWATATGASRALQPRRVSGRRRVLSDRRSRRDEPHRDRPQCRPGAHAGSKLRSSGATGTPTSAPTTGQTGPKPSTMRSSRACRPSSRASTKTNSSTTHRTAFDAPLKMTQVVRRRRRWRPLSSMVPV